MTERQKHKEELQCLFFWQAELFLGIVSHSELKLS